MAEALRLHPQGEAQRQRRARQPRRRRSRARKAHRVVEAEYEWPLQSHASMGPACAIAEMNGDEPRAVDRLAEAALRARRLRDDRRRAAGEGARDLDRRARLLRAQRCRRRGASTPRCSRSSPDVRCACSTCATTPPRWDPKGPAAVYRGRAGLDAAGNVVAYHFHGKGFSRQDVIQRESHPKDTLAGQLTGFPGKGDDHLPDPRPRRYEFENKRCSWETIPALLDRASPLRTGPLARPARTGDAFRERVVHRRGRARRGRRSGRVPPALPQGRRATPRW